MKKNEARISLILSQEAERVCRRLAIMCDSP